MRYKTLVCMNIAIIGAGKNTEALAEGLANAGHDVYIGLKDLNTYISPKLLQLGNIFLVSVEDAARESDVIVVTTPACEIREVAYMLGDVRRKTVVDLSSLNFLREERYSNTHTVLSAITGCKNMVKCYNVTGYEDLVNPDFIGATTDMFMAGNSKKSKEMVKLLARDLGFIDCCDFGEGDTIPMLDEMSNCWNNRAVKQKVVASLAYKLVKR